MKLKVTKYQLENGLDVLICPYRGAPWVSTQLWYNVGSKHETDEQRGAAHLLEHMLFKGTTKMSELDISAITDKLCGYSNAFTTQDHTGYIFDFPTAHWTYALDMLADCMTQATIKPDLLQSELAAVMQELRLYRDDYEVTLQEMMLAGIFTGHPYRHPILGYSHSLTPMNAECLMNFYKTWYAPNNAVLVIAGDVSEKEAFEAVKRAFNSLCPTTVPVYQNNTFWSPFLVSYTANMSCDINYLLDTTAFVIPGFKEKKHELATYLSHILAEGMSSTLYKKLVREQQRVTAVDAFCENLVDHDVLYIQAMHNRESDRTHVRSTVHEELFRLAKNGPKEHELVRAHALEIMEHQELFQDLQELATTIAHSFLATGDPYFGLYKPTPDFLLLADELQQYVQTWFNHTQAHYGQLQKITKTDLHLFDTHLAQQDHLYELFIKERTRSTPSEPLRYAPSIGTTEIKTPRFPAYEEHSLAHNSTLVTCTTTTTKTLELIVSFQYKHYHEPCEKLGIAEVTARLLLEGTKQHPGYAFTDSLEQKGMSLDSRPGYMSLSMIADDFQYGLDLLIESIESPGYDAASLECIKKNLCSDIDELYDDPYSCVDQYAKDALYKEHAYGRLSLGSKKTIKNITLDDVTTWHAKAYNPRNTLITIVGNISETSVVESIAHAWKQRNSTYNSEFLHLSPIPPVHSDPIFHKMNRDQTVLCYAGPSVKRTDTAYDALLLLDQIVCGGAFNSMYSLLFQIREKTGLFYTIQGSLVAQAGDYPGIVCIKTLVSPDKIKTAHHEINELFKHVKSLINQDSVAQARNALLATYVPCIISNEQLASLYSNLASHGLLQEYTHNLYQRLMRIDVEQVHKVAEQFLNPDKLTRITIGRSR